MAVVMGLLEAKRVNFASTVLVRVRNFSSLKMTGKKAWLRGGELENVLGDVVPGSENGILVSRNKLGNCGTVAYEIDGLGQRLVILWSSGMNCDKFANVVAVGVTTDLNTDKFSSMYFENQPWFRRQNFYFCPEPMVVNTDQLVISATMKIHPQADVLIELHDISPGT